MPKRNTDDSDSEREANKDQSALYFYNCQHGASNDPCPHGCFSTAPGLPDPEPVPDDWKDTYEAPTEGLQDSASLGSK